MEGVDCIKRAQGQAVVNVKCVGVQLLVSPYMCCCLTLASLAVSHSLELLCFHIKSVVLFTACVCM